MNYSYGMHIDSTHLHEITAHSPSIKNNKKKDHVISIQNNLIGSNNVCSNVADLYKLTQAINDTSFLNTKYRNEMFSPSKLNNGELVNYGLGWVIKVDKPKIVSHTGQYITYSSFIKSWKDSNKVLIGLFNSKRTDYWQIKSLVENTAKKL